MCVRLRRWLQLLLCAAARAAPCRDKGLDGERIVDTLSLDSIEFTFIPIGLEEGESTHRALFVGTLALPVIVIYRADGRKTARIAFDVPRHLAQAMHYTNHADVVRDVIGQAMRDNLFNQPPATTVYLDGMVPRWAGNLQLVHE
jgi:hypothetical protein